jgi:nitroreductase
MTEPSPWLATRRSVRHFDDAPVDRETLERVLTHAAWAPSGGNEQPWHVTALRPETARRYVEGPERLAWRALLPKLADVAARMAGRPLTREEALAAADARIHDEGLTRGAPWMLLLHAELPPGPAPSVLAAISAALEPGPHTPSIEQLAAMNGPINREVIRASVHGFAYAICLAAEAEGLASCIQHSPLLFADSLAAEHGVPADHTLLTTLLLGRAATDDPVNLRARAQPPRRRVVRVDVR